MEPTIAQAMVLKVFESRKKCKRTLAYETAALGNNRVQEQCHSEFHTL